MNIKNCWIITEGMAGTENQCIAVAEQLGVRYTTKRIGLQFPFNHLCPFVLKTAPRSSITGIDWNDDMPDLVIASGRKAVPVALQFPNAYTVFIQDPKIKTSNFDLVAAPQHDDVKGDNVIHTTAAPNRITDDLLQKAQSEFDFSPLPSKKIAILIGGNSKTHTMDDNFGYGLYESLLPYMQLDDYGFMITMSRRTPDNIANHIRDLFNDSKSVVWDGNGANPYHAFLAYADYILVTEDSTSMLSDALTTGKPVYKLPLQGGSEKFTRLYQNLKRRCLLKDFDGELKSWDYKPLNDAKKISDVIKEKMKEL